MKENTPNSYYFKAIGAFALNGVLATTPLTLAVWLAGSDPSWKESLGDPWEAGGVVSLVCLVVCFVFLTSPAINKVFSHLTDVKKSELKQMSGFVKFMSVLFLLGIMVFIPAMVDEGFREEAFLQSPKELENSYTPSTAYNFTDIRWDTKSIRRNYISYKAVRTSGDNSTSSYSTTSFSLQTYVPILIEGGDKFHSEIHPHWISFNCDLGGNRGSFRHKSYQTPVESPKFKDVHDDFVKGCIEEMENFIPSTVEYFSATVYDKETEPEVVSFLAKGLDSIWIFYPSYTTLAKEKANSSEGIYFGIKAVLIVFALFLFAMQKAGEANQRRSRKLLQQAGGASKQYKSEFQKEKKAQGFNPAELLKHAQKYNQEHKLGIGENELEKMILDKVNAFQVMQWYKKSIEESSDISLAHLLEVFHSGIDVEHYIKVNSNQLPNCENDELKIKSKKEKFEYLYLKYQADLEGKKENYAEALKLYQNSLALKNDPFTIARMALTSTLVDGFKYNRDNFKKLVYLPKQNPENRKELPLEYPNFILELCSNFVSEVDEDGGNPGRIRLNATASNYLTEIKNVLVDMGSDLPPDIAYDRNLALGEVLHYKREFGASLQAYQAAESIKELDEFSYYEMYLVAKSIGDRALYTEYLEKAQKGSMDLKELEELYSD